MPEYDLKRFEYVFMACEYLYYDNRCKVYRCALNDTFSDTLIGCKRCRKGNLRAYRTPDPKIDLRKCY